MTKVAFTANLQRHVNCPDIEVAGDTVKEVLAAVFSEHPEVQGYVVDDQWRLRKHMVVFVDGKVVKDRDELTDPVPPQGEVYVMQALSGG